MEISGSAKTITGIHTHTAFSVGILLNSLVAYCWRDWRQFYFFMSLTPIPYFIVHFFVSIARFNRILFYFSIKKFVELSIIYKEKFHVGKTLNTRRHYRWPLIKDALIIYELMTSAIHTICNIQGTGCANIGLLSITGYMFLRK